MRRGWLEFWKDFCDAWRNVKPGVGPLAVTAAEALSMPIPPLIVEASDGEECDGLLVWLANLLIVLQRESGSETVWLAQEDAGAVLGGVPRQRIAKLLGVLIDIGGIEKLSLGRSGRASEYAVFMKLAWAPDEVGLAESQGTR
ncbi:MAG: hypothetical protein AAFN41_11945 [Planctomycetota bacterium]